MTSTTRGVARFGILVPFTNVNLEADMALLRPDGVSMHFARLGGYDVDEVPDEKQMAGLGASDLDEPLRLIGGVRPHIVLYGCTSATLTHGPGFDRKLAADIETRLGVPTVTAGGALIHAMRTLGATNVGFSSPYVGAINDQAVDFFAQNGVRTVARADIGRALGNYGQGELTPEQVFDLAVRADHPDAQAIVLSCTDMRSVEAIARIEAAIGKPVITSNQAMLFQAMELLGLDMSRVRCGHLFQASRAAA